MNAPQHLPQGSRRISRTIPALLSVATWFLLGTACSQAPSPSLRDTPERTGVDDQGYSALAANGVVQDFATGVWAAPGYGRVLDVKARSIDLYHQASIGVCLRDPLPSSVLIQLMTWAKRDGSQLLVAPTLRSAPYRLEPLDQLPAACSLDPDTSAPATFEFFAASMAELYAFFDLYDVDWQQRVRKARPRITDTTTPEELFETLSSMLTGIDDGHVSLTGTFDGEERRFRPASFSRLRTLLDTAFAEQTKYTDAREYRQTWVRSYFNNIKTKLLDQAVSVHDDSVIWGMIRGTQVGYINIFSMDGYSSSGYPIDGQLEVQNIMDRALVDLKEARQIIVDVSFNGGGADEISATFASHFAAEPKLAYTKQPKGQNDNYRVEVFVRPSIGQRTNVPIALVTSGYTVSAAEIFTLLMRAIDGVEHYGTATAGALSDILDKPLPNGWNLGLSNEIYLDAAGNLLESTGIPPQHELLVFDDRVNLYESHWQAIVQLAKELGS